MPPAGRFLKVAAIYLFISKRLNQYFHYNAGQIRHIFISLRIINKKYKEIQFIIFKHLVVLPQALDLQ